MKAKNLFSSKNRERPSIGLGFAINKRFNFVLWSFWAWCIDISLALSATAPVILYTCILSLSHCRQQHIILDFSLISNSSSNSSSRFVELITQTPLMRHVSRCAANSQVFNADLKLLMLSVGSRRKSGNEYPDHRTRD